MKKNVKLIKENDVLDFYYSLFCGNEVIDKDSWYENFVVGEKNEDFVISDLSALIIGKTISEDNILEIEFHQKQDDEKSTEKKCLLSMNILRHEQKEKRKEEEKEIELEEGNNKSKGSKKDISKLLKENEDLREANMILENSFLEKVQEIENKTKTKIEEIKYLESVKLKNEIAEIKKYSLQKFVEELISPLSNLENAISFGTEKGSQEVQSYTKGFKLLTNQIFAVLNDFGIVEICPNIGDEFNPEFHHIFEMEQSDKYSENSIIEIKTKGYELNGRVIKPALVIVSKKK